jgi:hypothetical protein
VAGRPSNQVQSNGFHDAADTLPVVAGKINAFLDKADQASKKFSEYRISAGRLLIEARQRVDAGEAGDTVTWTQWLSDNVDRSERDCRRVMRLAGADDPHAALAKEREANRAQRAERREADIAMSGDDGQPADQNATPSLVTAFVEPVKRRPKAERIQFALDIIAALDLGLDELQPVKQQTGDPAEPNSKPPASEAPVNDDIIEKIQIEKIPVPAERAFGEDSRTALQEQYSKLSDRLAAYDWVMRRLNHGERPEKDDKSEVAEFVCCFIAEPVPRRHRRAAG